MFTKQELTDMIKIIDSFAGYSKDPASLIEARKKLIKMQKEEKG